MDASTSESRHGLNPSRLLDRIATPDGDAVSAWRKRIFAALSLGIVTLGFVAYVPAIWLSFKINALDVAVLDTIVFAMALIALLARRLAIAARMMILVSLPFLMGTYLLFAYGFDAVAPIWLVCLPVLVAILIGRKPALVATGVVTVVYAVLAWCVLRGMISWSDRNPDILGMIAMNALITIMLCVALSVAITTIFDGLMVETAGRSTAEAASLRLAHAIDQNTGYFLLFDDSCTVVDANRAGKELLESMSMAWDRQPFQSIRDRSPWSGTCEFAMNDGTRMQLSGSVSRVRSSEDGAFHSLVTLRDITRERQLEEQVAQAQRLAAIGTLAGGIAHDFNNLLQPILGGAEAIRLKQLDEKTLRLLDDIERSAQRGRTLVRRILDFTKPGRRERAPLNVGQLLAETERLLRAVIPQSIELCVEYEENVVVVAEAGELQQVLLNLATNAAQAMPDGGTLRLSASIATVSNNTVLSAAFDNAQSVAAIEVRDTGIGMDDATMKRIFDPFFTTRGAGTGTGLGLATAHSTIKDLGGIIIPQSEPHVGTTMTIHLPITTLVEPTPTLAEPQFTQSSGRRILVVDDEPTVLAGTGRALERMGWQATCVGDAREAASILSEKAEQFDCLMTDLSMPFLSGMQLAELAKRHVPEMPVILVTGYLDQDPDSTGFSMITTVLPKPFTSMELAGALTLATKKGPRDSESLS